MDSHRFCRDTTSYRRVINVKTNEKTVNNEEDVNEDTNDASLPPFGRRSKHLQATPILKWAGGKREQVADIASLLFAKSGRDNGTYFEPFIGGASVYLHLSETRRLPLQPPVLSDANPKIIELYRVIRDEMPSFLKEISENMMWEEGWQEHYEQIRDDFNKTNGWQGAAGTARLVWLNKHGFNGLYRENKSKKFNVPIGKFGSTPSCPTEDQIFSLSIALHHTILKASDFEPIIDKSKAKDYIYCDPPYVPIVENGFTGYTGGFSWEDQQRLAEVCNRAIDRKAKVVVSNHDLPEIRDLYRGWKFKEIQARRRISRTGDRTPAAEVLIWK
jgi:DNA adenine methylase